jgi:transcription initiation factor IIE alpha subunit
MSTYTTTATIDCGRCHVPLTGPKNPKSSDIFTCPRCGGQIRYDKAREQVGKLFRETVAKGLKDAFRKAGFR